MRHANLEKLKALRLFGMARALQELTGLEDRGQLDFDDQLALLIEREAADRTNAALELRLKRAHLRQAACFENLDLKTTRGLDKALIRDLFTCRWIAEHRHLILAGATGTGKSGIACALGNQAAREGYNVLYTRLSRLLDEIATARLGSGVARLMRRVAKVDLLILDDWAMSDLTAVQRRDLMEIVDDRHDRGSIILATQVPVDRWHSVIGDPTYADAILDRIVHAAYRIELKGESLRKARPDGATPATAVINQPASYPKETTLN
jgi:DNA replication protein DnaC